MPLSKRCQVRDKEEIKKELDGQTAFVLLKDGTLEEGLLVLSVTHGTQSVAMLLVRDGR